MGCCILDLSKLHMMKFHYGVIEKNFKGKYDLIYSDTDSLVYQVKHSNFYQWMKDNPEEFDLSEMGEKYKSDDNKNVLGKFKSEVGSDIITEFVALSAKSYCYKYNKKEVKKSKGVSLAVSNKTMSFADYKRVMITNKLQTRPIYSIRSFNQTIYSLLQDKIVLSPNYDKSVLLDAINTRPFGYYPK